MLVRGKGELQLEGSALARESVDVSEFQVSFI